MKKICQHCGKEFEPGKPFAKFCSAKCRVYYNRGLAKWKFPFSSGSPPTTTTPVENKPSPQPPPGLTGIDLAIWKAEQKQK